MKKYISKIFVLIPVLFIFSGFNYWVDPENLFQGGQYEKGMATFLLQGKNVTGLYNYDERLLQKYFIQGMHTPPDVVVLGPSRSLLINASVLGIKGLTVINNSISGPTIEDQLAIFEMYLQKGWHPKRIIIGVDPYFLNEQKTARNLYGSIRDYYYQMSDTLGIPIEKKNGFALKYGNYKKLFLIQYFQESALFLLSTGNNHEYLPTDSSYNTTLTKLTDGSITYSKEQRERSVENVENRVKTISSEELAGYFQPIENYDQDYIRKFGIFIDYLKRKGIEIDLVMPPFHPLWYAHFTGDAKFKSYLATEDFFINFAHSKHIRFFGSLNPALCGVDENEFYDEMHLKPSGMRKVFQHSR